MSLVPGTRLGVYEVLAAIGAGGMGEVYRARDTRLHRDVALKLLPPTFASDPQRMARFEREAQLLASLNHPHIASVYGLEESGGQRAIVMELVEGPEVRGPLPVDEALQVTRQVAEAMETAHERGIIHRDLKPANIKLTPDGVVKVLDFGLAKALEGVDESNSETRVTLSPTLPLGATQVGMVLGTAAYMAPEQAKGKTADRRADIWSFGVVLYELLTGHRLFGGETVAETLASVMKDAITLDALPAGTPPGIRRLLQRCLERDVRRRLQSMGEARIVIEDTLAGASAGEAVSPVGPRSSRRFLMSAAAAGLAALVGGAVVWALRPDPPAPALTRFVEPLPDGVTFTNTGRQAIAISRDGTQVAFTANNRIYVRRIGEVGARPLPGEYPQPIMSPVFSPDGEWIAFFSPGGDQRAGVNRRMTLSRIPVTGGSPSPIAAVQAPFGVTWQPGGILIGQVDGVVRVAPTGGAVEPLIRVEPGEVAHGPQMLPDGKTVLFTRARRDIDNPWDRAEIVAHSLVDGSQKVLVNGASDARYLPSGHLIYAVAGTLFAVPFDAQRVATLGSPIPVVVGVSRSAAGQTGTAHIAVSDTGVLAYRPGRASASSAVSGLFVGNGAGTPQSLPVPAGRYSHPRVSPDGRLVAVSRSDGDQRDIWLYDLGGKVEFRRLTFGGNNHFPVWSNDGRRVTFQSTRDGAPAVFWQAQDGSGTAERLTTPSAGEEHTPEGWSPDGARLLFAVRKSGTSSLRVLTLEGRTVEPFGQVQSAEGLSASFSPDGRWVAYASTTVAGGAPSPDRGVFVEPFPATGEKHQAPKVAIDFHPAWARDGRSLLYVASSNRGLISVPISTRPSVTFGNPVELARAPNPGLLSTDVRGYDVLPDRRIVALVRQEAAAESVSTDELRFVLNWFEELTRLVPRN